MKKVLLIVLSALLISGLVDAQEHHHDSLRSKSSMPSMPGMEGMDMDIDMSEEMPHALSLNLPMNRNGSGTSWLPDATPMYGYMIHSNDWMFMFHGNIFVRYNKQDLSNKGSRGGERWDAPDMVMGMAQRKIGENGLLHFNLMMSADAIVTGGYGYPLLFQTGESWKGKPLVDRQHPHDLFSELSASYAYSFSKRSDLSVYVGYPGEPALGPVAFMHRPSAMFNPDAPIGHHWEDATHITFGVATLGYRYGRFKLEGSLFTGREPDENRYDFDKPRFDSWSGRLSFNPGENWALQISHGFIKSPEALNPDENVNRTTASATFVKPFNSNSYFSATVLWGQNKISAQPPSNAALMEATQKWRRLALYVKYEWVQKSVEELDLDASYGEYDHLFSINTGTLGISYDLLTVAHTVIAGGAQMTVNKSPEALKNLYGTAPIAGEVYLHFYPGKM